MKILKIRLKNINSLYGEWSIDFDHPEFKSSSIFLITGQTGSGKSTILDAISLALYGRTPRLDKISKNNNELISRNTQDCFSEVTFETQKGIYRAYWGQNRARHKTSGELQQPKRELFDIKNNEILETKINGVEEKINEITGMNYDQFTRSILLAQGDFASFLKANFDERSAILEQITGTKIYSEISIAVHEKRKAKQGQLDSLKKGLESLKLLTLEEESELELEYSNGLTLEKRYDKELAKLNEAANKMARKNELEFEIEGLEEELSNFKQGLINFGPQELRLIRAKEAKKLYPEYKELQGLEETLKNISDNLSNKEEENRNLSKQREDSRIKLENINISLQIKEEEKESLEPILKEVRRLDSDIQSKTEKLGIYKKLLSEAEDKRIKSIEQNESIKIDIAKIEDEIEGLKKYIVQNSAFENINSILPDLKAAIERLKDLRQRNRDKEIELNDAHKQEEENSLDIQANSDELNKTTIALKRLLSEEDSLEKEIIKILSDRSIDDLNVLLDRAKSDKSYLEICKSIQEEIEGLDLDINKEIENFESLLLEREKLERERDRKETEKSLIDEFLAENKDKYIEFNLLKNFENARELLREGEPCPVCGSVHHPYKQGEDILINNSLVEEYNKKIGYLEIIKADISETNTQLAILENKIKHSALEKDRLEKNKNDLLNKLKDNKNKISYQINIDFLGAEIEENELNIIELEGNIREYKSLRDSLDRKNKERLNFQENLGMQKEAFSIKKQKAENISAIISNLTSEKIRLTDQIKLEEEKILSILKDYGFDTCYLKELDNTYADLKIKSEDFLKKKNSVERLQVERANKTDSFNKGVQDAQQIQEEMKKYKAQFDGISETVESLKSERSNIFKADDPDKCEEKIKLEISRLEKELEADEDILNSLEKRLSFLNGEIESTKQKKLETESSLQAKQLKFENLLEEYNFKNKKGFEESLLSDEDVAYLDKELERLKKGRDLTTVRIDEKRKELDEIKRLLGEENITLDQITNEVDGLKLQLKDVRENMGSIKQRLSANNEIKESHNGLAREVELREGDLNKYHILCELIGSSDGKKFRSFAQELTLDILIRHANRHLRKITDRYILTRNKKEKLCFSVIDNYQAGEVRSTKNLSGGESFIVSLALALGLSSMSSMNVRVDSLFLDEGFGTLDDETLETALDAISNLKQENKTIGIISHLTYIQERIGTHIRVTQKPGGKSLISGPGVKRC